MVNLEKFRNRRLLWPVAVVFLSLLTAPVPAASAPAGPPGNFTHAPLLEDSFAVSSAWGGDMWPIFVQGSDPKGDMQYIWFEITQLGGRNSTEIVYLRGENRREFSGYVAVYLPRIAFGGWQTVRAEIKLKDAAGNYSEKRIHEVRVGAPTREGMPEKWRMAMGRHLGNIFFNFDSEHGDNFRSDFRHR